MDMIRVQAVHDVQDSRRRDRRRRRQGTQQCAFLWEGGEKNNRLGKPDEGEGDGKPAMIKIERSKERG